MTYEDTLTATVTLDEAVKELRAHSVDDIGMYQFFAECGRHKRYEARDVLDWLGY